MCGIAGLLDPERGSSTDQLGRLSEAMAATLVHRGPDDRGSWVDPHGGVALGHCRLAVVDLSVGGHQPMTSPDGRWVIAFNGEIYNHPDLRRLLVAEGAEFAGTSDTEVLVVAVERWGVERTLGAIEGMFAFSLWDRSLRQLHLVRDRFGEKPLYYGWVGRRLAFTSELRALREVPDFSPEIDRDAVAAFLRHNCIPAPATAYRGIEKLGPGQILTIGAEARPGAPLHPRPYWSALAAIGDERGRPVAGSAEHLADLVEHELSRSVGERMVADVPVGAFLSGGVDSSLVVALMQRAARQPVRTYTVGFDEPEFDESEEAAAVAAHLGTDHTALRVDAGDVTELIPRLADVWDEPFADVSQIPMLLVSRLARSEVTVALSGDGGDELFAGYNRHTTLDRLWNRAAPLPGPLRRTVGSALQAVPPGWVDRAATVVPDRWSVRMPGTKVTKAGAVLAASSPEDAYRSLTSHWGAAESMVIGATGHPGTATGRGHLEGAGITEQMLWLDLAGYLPDDILTKLDRAAMASSLETRVPFLDRGVFELAWRLPMDVKVRGGVGKWLLRQILYRHVPKQLVDRPKMGFGVPIGSWLRGPLRPWAEELLEPGRLRRQGLLEVQPVTRAWEAHRSGRRDLAYPLWDVLMLQSWMDRWMPGSAR